MMWFWIALAVWIVGMWPTAYLIGRYDEANDAIIIGWPIWAVFVLFLVVPEWFAKLGEKHAREKGE